MANWLQRFASPGQGNKVFGGSLADATKRSPNGIPLVLIKCIEYLNNEEVLKQEGLFRKSGNHTQIQDMKQRIDKGEDVDLSKIQDPHTVCGLMKQYLRELPEPLCTFELYDCFIAAIGIPEETMRRQQLANVLDMLPEQNQILTKYLISFLVRVSSYASDNLMTAANLATVFAPNLIRPPGDDLGALVEYTPHSNRTMETLILHYDELLAKFPDPAPVSTPPAEIHQKSGWNHMKILPQGWKPNSTPAAQPAAATATATNTSNAPLPTGPPPPLPPHPTASYSSTPPALPPYNAAAYAPLPTGPPPPLPPAPHNSTSSSLNSQQPPQPLPRPAQLSYYGAQAASSSGPYQTRTMTVPHDGSGSGSEILPRRPAPQRPPPAQPSPTLPAGLPPIPAGSGLGRAQLTGSDPAAAAPASPNQGRPLPTRQPEGETVGKKWLPLAGSGTQDASNTYPPAQSPLATSSLDDPSIPRRGARVMKKDEVSKVQTSSVTAMITKSMQNSSSSSSSSSTPSASSSSSTTSSSASASKLIKPFVPPTGVSASTRGPSPSAAAKQQQTRNPSHTVSGAAPPFASTAPPVAYSRPPASPSLGSSGSSSLASTNNNVTYAQQPAKASSMIGGQVSVSPSIQERMRNFGS